MSATTIRCAHLFRHTHFLRHASSPFVGVKCGFIFSCESARRDKNLIALLRVFVTQERIELNPRHVGLGDVCDMATGTFGNGRLRGGLGIRQRMMAESEEAPAICIREPLAVFDSRVDAVVGAVEEPASRWFCTRAVRESRTQNASQLFDDYRSFGERTCFQVRIDVFRLDVDVMIFGESRFPVVEAVWRQRGAYENPPAKSSWQLQLAVGFKHRRRLRSLSNCR